MTDVWLNTYNICKKYIESYSVGLDIGCRRGDFAQHMIKDFDFVHGWDFRAKQAHIRKLSNLDYNKFHFHNVGLGEDNYITYSKAGVGRIKGEGNFKIEVKTLDSYELENISFIKIDVEGYEPKVLAGAEQTIKRNWPVLCVEINTPGNDSKQILESWGYVLKEIDDLQNHDYIFIKE